MPAADEIRDYAYAHFIKPSRERSHSVVAIAARDIHDGLGLSSKFPNVCQALSGQKFYPPAYCAPPLPVGINIYWPEKDEAALARAVVG